MIKAHGWSLVVPLFSVAVLGTVLHCSLGAPVRLWSEILPSVYYIPIVIAAIDLGTRTAVGVALAAGASHAIASTFGCGDSWIRPFSETLLLVCVAVTAGKLTEMHASVAGRRNALLTGPRDESLERTFSAVHNAKQVPGFSQVVASLIHRFRTPVSSIEGAVWLLEDARFSEEKRQEFVGIIRKESHQLDRALSDILDFTQPRKPRLHQTNLSNLLDDVIQLAGPKEHGPFFLFRKNLSSDPLILRCDHEQIRNLLLNLVMNAIQATPGGGQITISARTESGHVVISIEDHGRGIPPGLVDKIFEPFFTTRENGLGLGLAVARQIAAAHGGTSKLDRSSDKGTSVSVVLPLKPSDAHEHGQHTSG